MYKSDCFKDKFLPSRLLSQLMVLFEALLLSLYGGKAFANDYAADVSVPASWSYVPEKMQEIPGGVSDHWWSSFADSMLDSLIAMGVERNFDVKMAMRRMEIARAAMNQAKSAWYPTLTAEAGWETKADFNAGLSASWEIDLFGKIADNVKGKRAEYRAGRAEYAGAMVSMASQIASTYFSLRGYQQMLIIAQRHCANQMKIVKIAQARYEAQLASKLDVAQAWQTYYSTASTIPQIENNIQTTINSLGILIGEYPQQAAALLSKPNELPRYDIDVSAGIPADLLRYRPDIVEAELKLASMAASLGVAKKDFLPTLTIEGSISTAAHNLSNLFSDKTYSWSVSPTLSWTLFNGFSRKYQLVSAREQLQNALENYRLTVMTAVNETETAISSYDAYLRQISSLRKLCEENNEVLQLSITRYKDSLSTMNDVVNALISSLTGETSLVQAEVAALNALVSLYEALGGGIGNPADFGK